MTRPILKAIAKLYNLLYFIQTIECLLVRMFGLSGGIVKSELI